jgi:hypothetical protein
MSAERIIQRQTDKGKNEKRSKMKEIAKVTKIIHFKGEANKHKL